MRERNLSASKLRYRSCLRLVYYGEQKRDWKDFVPLVAYLSEPTLLHTILDAEGGFYLVDTTEGKVYQGQRHKGGLPDLVRAVESAQFSPIQASSVRAVRVSETDSTLAVTPLCGPR